MPNEPIMTETQVKTKTVSKATVALSLAFLGAAALAAAGAGLQTQSTCTLNNTVSVDVHAGWPTNTIYACKGTTIKPTNSALDSFLVRNYDANNLVVRINGQYVTYKYGDNYKPIGKPLGNIPGYQTPVNLMYLGVQNGRASMALFVGEVIDGKAGNCTDFDQSTQNFGGFPLAEKKFINPYVKSFTDVYENGTHTNFEEKCGGLYDVVENYCNLATDQLETATIKCDSECVDGACKTAGAKIIALNGETVVECCNTCKTFDTTCPPNQPMTQAECGAVGGKYLGLVPYSQCLPVAKTCNDALNNPESYAMFGFCKDKGYKSVCFNKYTLAYQVCSDENGTGCITAENPNAANNIRCLTAGATSSTYPGVGGLE